MFDRNAYLARIGFIQRDAESQEDRLIRLHRCHSLSIPFESFSPFCAEPVSLTPEDVFKKVIRHRRGGYCFELNLLFQQLLEDFGYQVRPIFCRPFSGEGAMLPLTHRMMLVFLGERTWIADVGLGGNGWIEPLVLEPGLEQQQYGRTYQITQDPELGYVVQIRRGADYVNAVAFTTQRVQESDFLMSNYYTATHPASPFVNRMMCTLPTLNGRYTIRDTKLRIEANGKTEESELEAHTFTDTLSHWFHIELSAEMNEYIREYLSACHSSTTL